MTNGNGQAVDMGGPTSYKWIGDMVNSGIMTQHHAAKMRMEMERNPCDFAAAIREKLAADGAVNTKAVNAVAKMRQYATFLPDIIGEIFERRGHFPPGSNLSGGKTLGEYALEVLGPEALIPPDVQFAMAMASPLLPPPIAMTQPARFVDDHMPTGLALVSGSWYDDVRGPDSRDERLAPGVYLSPKKTGPARRYASYKGHVIRQLIDNWMRYEINNVYSTEFPNVRRNLVLYAGTWEGSGPYGVFDPYADEVLPGSKVADLLLLQSEMNRIEAESRGICNGLAASQGQLLADMTEAEMDARTRGLEIERAAAEKSAKQKDLLVVGGLLLGALIAVRST